MIAAVFDVDRTLLPGTTAERLFLRYLTARRELGLRDLVRTAWFVLRRAPWEPKPLQQARRHRPYLAGKEIALLEDLGRRCFEEVIQPQLAPEGERRLAAHRAAGHVTILLSGSLPYLLRPMAEALRADAVIGSVMATRGSRLAGRLEGLHPYGREKLRLVEGFALAHDVALPGSYAYADHHSDLHLLAGVGHPVAVNPNDRLRAVAEARGWPIESWT